LNLLLIFVSLPLLFLSLLEIELPSCDFTVVGQKYFSNRILALWTLSEIYVDARLNLSKNIFFRKTDSQAAVDAQ
jgi:hypothetical protein